MAAIICFILAIIIVFSGFAFTPVGGPLVLILFIMAGVLGGKKNKKVLGGKKNKKKKNQKKEEDSEEEDSEEEDSEEEDSENG